MIRFWHELFTVTKFIAKEQKEFILSKQILRSGTSIGANIEEASQGQSKNDVIHKLSIAQKEALKLIIGCGFYEIANF